MSASKHARGQLLRAIREQVERMGYTQRQIALALGIAQPNLSAVLSGKKSVSVDRLLDVWVGLGGSWDLRLGRIETERGPGIP